VTGISVRRLTRADGDHLRTIRLESLLDSPDAYGSTYEESLGITSEQWAQRAGSWNRFAAFYGDRPIGMASGGFHDSHNQTWLFGMFVTPEHRGSGVAQQLVHAVATWARTQYSETLGLHVTETMTRARAFYEKMGFVPTGETEPMERNPELRLLIMKADLVNNDRI